MLGENYAAQGAAPFRGAVLRLGVRPRICVVGVGGGGCNAVTHMIRNGVDGVDFIAINTDARMLAGSDAGRRILLRRTPAKGRRATDIGRRAARRSLVQIRNALSGANMCFIAAGMGGETATGAVAVIAAAAREMGILTIAAVTRPFTFEGRRRQRLAERGIEELRRNADTLIVLPNQNLLRAGNDYPTLRAALDAADEVLEHGVRSITDLIIKPGIVNVDFADVRAVMQNMGKAVLGTGEGIGMRRAVEAARCAIANPLLDGALDGARNLIISIVGGEDMRLVEIDEAAKIITRRVHPEARIVWGSAQDSRLKGRIRVSVVATGIEVFPARSRLVRALPCLFGRHRAHPSVTLNQGFIFGTCRDCGRDLIRSGSEWKRVPRGFQVVWRRGDWCSFPAAGGLRPVRTVRRLALAKSR